MYCPNCGNKLNDNDKFCTKCGFNMKEEESEHKLPLGPVIVIIVAVMAIAVSGIFMFNQWQKSEKNSETVSNSKEEKQQKKDLKVENTPVPANTPTLYQSVHLHRYRPTCRYRYSRMHQYQKAHLLWRIRRNR